jgi:hypothetical protein
MAQPTARSTFPSNILNPASTTTPAPAQLTTANTPDSTGSNNNTFLMSASPARSRRSAPDGYKPKMISTIGAKPACLVNASVTYVGDDQIYAFGGFDQYTDEGEWYATVAVVRERTGRIRVPDDVAALPGWRSSDAHVRFARDKLQFCVAPRPIFLSRQSLRA